MMKKSIVKYYKIILSMLIVLSMGFLSNVQSVYALDTKLKVHYIDVGGADSILIECNGEVALIDGGYGSEYLRKGDDTLSTIVDETMGKRLSNVADKEALKTELKNVLNKNPENDVVNYLKKIGIKKIDLLISTHPHVDHVSGLLSVLCNFEVKKILKSSYTYDTAYAQFFDAFTDDLVKSGKSSVSIPNDGEKFYIGGQKGATLINFTNPLEQYNTRDLGNDVNNYSLVMRMDYGKRSFLFTGDAQRAKQAALLKKYSKEIVVDILKQPHHGYSNMDEGYTHPTNSGNYDFTRIVNADITIISCDDITPTQKVLNDASHSDIFTTYNQGDIVMNSDGSKVDISYKDKIVYAFYNGDTNCDGQITPSDYVQVRRQLLGTMKFKGSARTSADVNGDGEITPSDYVLIRRHLLGTYKIP